MYWWNNSSNHSVSPPWTSTPLPSQTRFVSWGILRGTVWWISSKLYLLSLLGSSSSHRPEDVREEGKRSHWSMWLRVSLPFLGGVAASLTWSALMRSSWQVQRQLCAGLHMEGFLMGWRIKNGRTLCSTVLGYGTPRSSLTSFNSPQLWSLGCRRGWNL